VNGWGVAPIAGTWTVPTDGSVTHVAVRPHVTDDATAGTVKFDNMFLNATQKMPQRFTDMLPEDLASLLNWTRTVVESALGALGITASGNLLDDIFDLSDELEWIKDHASEAWSDLQTLVGNLLSNPAAVLGTIPQTLVGGLEATFNQLEDIYQGLIATPVNSFVQSVKDWFNTWFGGGSSNAIPMSMRGVANGVAPLNASAKVPAGNLPINEANGIAGLNGSTKLPTSLLITDTANNVPTLDGSGKLRGGQLPSMDYIPNSSKGVANGVAPLNSNAVVPLANLPEEVGGAGGTGAGRPYFILSLTDSQSIPNNTTTLLSGWNQVGTASVEFEDAANARWRFGLEGLWSIQYVVAWSESATGLRAAGVFREYMLLGKQDIPILQTSMAGGDSLAALNLSGALPTLTATTVERVSDYSTSGWFSGTRSSDDWFSIQVKHTQGGSISALGEQSLLGGYSFTYVIRTYLGAS